MRMIFTANGNGRILGEGGGVPFTWAITRHSGARNRYLFANDVMSVKWQLKFRVQTYLQILFALALVHKYMIH